MFPPDPTSGWTADRYGGRAAAISLTLHAVAFAALIHAPAITLPRPSESEYRQSFARNESRIVWYKIPREMPRVSRTPMSPVTTGLRAENRAHQAIVSWAPNAPKRARMTWTPAPAIRDVTPLDSANVVAIKLPPAPVKPFVAPAEKGPAEVAMRMAMPAPDVAARSLDAARLPGQALAPKPFTAPEVPQRQQAAREVVTAEAPEIAALEARAATNLDVRLAPKPFTAPSAAPPGRMARVIAASEAPAVKAVPGEESVNLGVKLAPKPFSAPPRGQRGTARTAAGAGVEPAPPALEANSRDLSLAVAGLKPGANILPPRTSSPADFSAGKELRKDGVNAQPGQRGLVVPGLFVGKARENSHPDLLANALDAPTSATNLRAAMRIGSPIRALTASSASGAVPVTDIPEPRFNGREVFMMAIQMPNLTSYSGSWLMWYAGRTRHEAELAPISPPIAHRKVDPKYNPISMGDRIEGKVRLACVITKQGTVADIELLRGLEDTLNRNAEEALAKWEFYPATRNGEPVDVDVVVDIPFRPEPPAPER